jgi:hypothetical protein
MQSEDKGFVGESLEIINIRLADIYGTTLTELPKYRIVKADDQYEKRRGMYVDYLDGTNIIIRKVIEVREVLKYPNSLGYYILEKWIPLPTIIGEIYNHNGYEQLWVFRNKDYTPQPLYWRAISFLVNMNINGINKSLADIWDEKEKIEREEFEYFMDYLNAEAPAFDGALNAGEAAVVQGLRDTSKKKVTVN